MSWLAKSCQTLKRSVQHVWLVMLCFNDELQGSGACIAHVPDWGTKIHLGKGVKVSGASDTAQKIRDRFPGYEACRVGKRFSI